MFGGYLTDAPHPAPHYYGTGECFLWRASVLSPPTSSLGKLGDGPPSDARLDLEHLQLAGLPPPPSADTTHLGRLTTLRGEKSNTNGQTTTVDDDGLLVPLNGSAGTVQTQGNSGRSTPEPIRFKAFPYSGVNDYMIFCETGFLSLGGG